MNRQRGSVLLLYAIAAIAILGILGGIARSIYVAGADSVRLEWDAAKQAQREKEAKAIASATTKLEARNEKTRTVYRTITKEVDKLVVEYRDRPCLDPAGMRLANCAIRGQSSDTCKPDSPLPRTGTPN